MLFFIFFVLSNIVKCNLCKSYIAYIADCKSTTTYYSFKFIIFAFKIKYYFSIFLFAANYKVKKHCMSSAGSIKSVCLIWMLSLVPYICFSFSFVIAINIWKMQKSCLWILCTIVSVQNWGTCKFFVMLTEKFFLLLLKLLLVNSLMFHFYSTLPFFNKVLFYDYYS